MEFNPHTAYWKAEDGRIFSGPKGALIQEDDPNYQAWLGAGNVPSNWPRDEKGEQTDAELASTRAAYGIGAEPEAPLSLPSITPRQFAAGLWGDKVITFAECDAYVSIRTVPEALQAILDTLPDDDTGEPTPRKDATILLKGAAAFDFEHPLTDTIRLAQGWTPEHLRERWAIWASL